MTKKEANNILRRIYRALRNDSIKVKITRSIHPWFGSCDISDDVADIKINPKKTEEFWLTLIHEALHLVNFEDEEWVAKTEKELFHHLSDRQLSNLLTRFMTWIQ